MSARRPTSTRTPRRAPGRLPAPVAGHPPTPLGAPANSHAGQAEKMRRVYSFGMDEKPATFITLKTSDTFITFKTSGTFITPSMFKTATKRIELRAAFKTSATFNKNKMSETIKMFDEIKLSRNSIFRN
jgi:hypothetical protein